MSKNSLKMKWVLMFAANTTVFYRFDGQSQTSGNNLWDENRYLSPEIGTKNSLTHIFDNEIFILLAFDEYFIIILYFNITEKCRKMFYADRISWFVVKIGFDYSSVFGLIQSCSSSKKWKFSKQFRERVKHRCTLHFVHITFVLKLQSSFLQRVA